MTPRVWPFTDIDKTKTGAGMGRMALNFFFFCLFCFLEHTDHSYLKFLSSNSTM